MRTNNKTLVVANIEQKILWETELSGQISDGHWENSRPWEHWKPWCDAKVEVGEEIGRDFYARRCNYNFTDRDLLEVVGDRMLFKVKVYRVSGIADTDVLDRLPDDLNDYYTELRYADKDRGGYWDGKLLALLEAGITEEVLKAADAYEGYTMKDMRKDLVGIKKACKTLMVD